MFIKAVLLVYAVSLAAIAVFILGAWAQSAWARRTVGGPSVSPLHAGEGASVVEAGARDGDAAAPTADVPRRPAA